MQREQSGPRFLRKEYWHSHLHCSCIKQTWDVELWILKVFPFYSTITSSLLWMSPLPSNVPPCPSEFTAHNTLTIEIHVYKASCLFLAVMVQLWGFNQFIWVKALFDCVCSELGPWDYMQKCTEKPALKYAVQLCHTPFISDSSWYLHFSAFQDMLLRKWRLK